MNYSLEGFITVTSTPIFIVHENWRGIFSIMGAFSSEDKADEAIHEFENYEDFYITEGTLDVPLMEA